MRNIQPVTTDLVRILLPMALAYGLMLTGALAQPVAGRQTCPPNLRANGSVCITNVPGSLRNTGLCPAGYVSTADQAYCVLAPRNQWVLVKPGCPEGYRESAGGESCTGK